MTKNFIDYKGYRIKYLKINASKNNKVTILYLHGLNSDMCGYKPQVISKYCEEHGLGFVIFDNYGHGDSDGKLVDGTIGIWFEVACLILNSLINGPIIVVGSSMGGWLALLLALKYSQQITAVIGLAPAPDFTEDLMWGQASDEQKQRLMLDGKYTIGPKDFRYDIGYQLITEGRNHLMMRNDTIEILQPMRLIHGMDDDVVPYELSIKIAEKVVTSDVQLSLIKDANHSLARETDATLILKHIEELTTEKK